MLRTLILFALCSWSTFAEKDIPKTTINNVVELNVDSSINPATLSYLESGFRSIKSVKGSLVLIRMNTPGGLVSTTKEILTLFGQRDIPVVVWVTPGGASATSAGSIIASGAHAIFMAPGTNIGAATPIQMSGDIKQEDVRKKAINDLVALVTGLSQARGRNPDPFEKMITDGASFSSKAAIEKGISLGEVSTRQELFKQLGGATLTLQKGKTQIEVDEKVAVEKRGMDWGQSLLNVLANPSLAYILFILAAALIYLELQAPGGFIAGSLGAVCLVLAGISFQVLPLNFGALALIILGFILFVIEIYVTSYGLLSLGGVVSVVFGSLFLFRSEEGSVELPPELIASTVAGVVLFLGLAGWIILRDRQKLKGKQAFFDQKGRTARVSGRVQDLDAKDAQGTQWYGHQIRLGGETWRAITSDSLEEGEQVKILDKDESGLKFIISKFEFSNSSQET